MLIHSVTPIQYLLYEPEIPQIEAKAVPFGYAYGEKSADGFKINSIFSTDPSVYLNNEYNIGGFLKD
ncbi:MAG: hypothetical protein RSC41_02910 [Oscillospiraceae bacterium]